MAPNAWCHCEIVATGIAGSDLPTIRSVADKPTDGIGAGLSRVASRGRKTLVVARVLLTIRGTGSIRTGDTPLCVVHFSFAPIVFCDNASLTGAARHVVTGYQCSRGRAFIDVCATCPITGVSRVAFTGEAAPNIDTRGVIYAVVGSVRAFIDVGATHTISGEPIIAFTLEASYGVCADGVVIAIV